MKEATINITDRATSKTETDVSFVVLSDKRLLIIGHHYDNTVIPLDEIRAVEAGKGLVLEKISFCTPSLSVIFDQGTDSARVRNLFIHVLGKTQQTKDKDKEVQAGSTPQKTIPKKNARVVVCPGCAATVIVR